MAYRLTFFCRADEDNGQEAINRLLDEVLSVGDPLLAEWLGPFPDEVAVYALVTSGPGGHPAADWLTLEVHVGVAGIADSVIAASPDDAHGIWGCDLLATVTLSGDTPDRPLVNRIRTALTHLWGAVPWDDVSGFEIAGSPS